MRRPRLARTLVLSAASALALHACGCASCERRVEQAPRAQPGLREPPPAPPAASYEVHEWGLVRGNLADHVVLSGPHREPVAIPVAKPVLYFHRDGEGPLTVDVEVTLTSGSVVEHWPLVADASGPSLAWRGVTIAEGNCRGARYPTLSEPPCSALAGMDACEASELGSIETSDGDCLSYAGASWEHLFYRGELVGDPGFPLRLTPLTGDRYRVTAERPVVGRLVRVRGTSASVIDAPAAGASLELEVPGGAIGEGAEALADALADAGLTPDEVGAFRRAWDATLFPSALASVGGEVVTTTTPVAMPLAGGLMAPQTRDALLYVLSSADADRLATLRFTPAPRAVRRAIVVWLDLARARPAFESPY